MKILIVAGIFPPDIGGPAGYTEKIVSEFFKRGHAVAVICYSDSKAGLDYPYKVSRVFRGKFFIKRYFLYFLTVLKLAKNFDIIYCQDSVAVGLPCVFASLFLRKKFVLKIVGDISWEYARNWNLTEDEIDYFQKRKSYPFLIKVMRRAQKFVCQRSKTIIVPSFYLKKIVEGWGITSEKIKVIYNAVEPIIIEKSREELRNNFGFSGSKIILSVGRLVSWKGFEDLIAMMPELIKKETGAKLVIIGDGPQRNGLIDLIKKFNLEKEVVLVGRLSRQKVGEYLKAADVFVLNSSYEGLPHIVLEAMSVGCPVMASKAGGNIEVVEDEVSGFLIKENNLDDWRLKILNLLSDDILREKFIKNGHQKLEGFSFEKMISRTLQTLSVFNNSFNRS